MDMSCLLRALKVSTFRAHPFQRPLWCIYPHQGGLVVQSVFNLYRLPPQPPAVHTKCICWIHSLWLREYFLGTGTHLHLNSSAHGYICTWIHLHMDSSAPGFICTWIHLHLDSSAHRFICPWIHLHMDSSAPGFICTWIHLHMNSPALGSIMDSSAHGFICTWIHLNLHSSAQWFICTDLWIDLGSKPGTIHWLNEMVGPFLLSAPKNFALAENNRIPGAFLKMKCYIQNLYQHNNFIIMFNKLGNTGIALGIYFRRKIF